MATWFVNSAAVGTGAGTSWVNACTTLNAAITLSSAGDDFNIANTHAETGSGANLVITFKGTLAAPNRVFSCDTVNQPAQASDLLAGASIQVTGSRNLQIGGCAYIYGVSFKCGTSTDNCQIFLGGLGSQQNDLTFDTCAWVFGGTGSNDMWIGDLTANFGSRIRWVNTTYQVATTAALLHPGYGGGNLTWKDTASAIQGATLPTTLFNATGGGVSNSVVVLDAVDFSALAAGKTLFGAATAGIVAQIINCRLGAGVTVAATPGSAPARVDVIISDSGATGYRQEQYDVPGTMTTSTTVYNNATDGVTPISWQVATNANAFRQAPFACFEIAQWAAAGTYSATTIQCTSATAALTNADVWVEAHYLGNASYPLASAVSSAPATQLTAGSPLASGTWAHGGLGNNYKLAVPSFTTAIAGYVRFVVKVGKASLTINIDPAVTIA